MEYLSWDLAILSRAVAYANLSSASAHVGLSQPLVRFIGEKIPERRGIKDDLTEAVLQGLVRAVALVVASVIVRALAASRR